VILACTRPLAAAACSNRSESEQNHGYENEWEETHNDEEAKLAQDHQPRRERKEDHCAEDGR
jgi:hypothetical protein